MKLFSFPKFKHPDIVKIATIFAVAICWLTVHHEPYLEKPAFQLAMGFGMLYLTAAGWALMGKAGNTAVYIVLLGVVLLLFGFTFTSGESIAALATEAIIPMVISGGGTLFHIALKEMQKDV